MFSTIGTTRVFMWHETKGVYEYAIDNIRNAYSMKTIMDNPLVKNIFHVSTNKEDDMEHVKSGPMYSL